MIETKMTKESLFITVEILVAIRDYYGHVIAERGLLQNNQMPRFNWLLMAEELLLAIPLEPRYDS